MERSAVPGLGSSRLDPGVGLAKRPRPGQWVFPAPINPMHDAKQSPGRNSARGPSTLEMATASIRCFSTVGHFGSF